MKIKYYIITLLGIVLLFNGCETTFFKPSPSAIPTGAQDIHHALWHGEANNQLVAQNSTPKPTPAIVNSALLSSSAATQRSLLPVNYERRFNVLVDDAPRQNFFYGFSRRYTL